MGLLTDLLPSVSSGDLPPGSVSNSELAVMPVETIKGNATDGITNPQDLTVSATKSLLNLATTSDVQFSTLGVGVAPTNNVDLVGANGSLFIDLETAGLTVISQNQDTSNILTIESLGNIDLIIDSGNNGTGSVLRVRNNDRVSDSLLEVDEVGNITADGSYVANGGFFAIGGGFNVGSNQVVGAREAAISDPGATVGSLQTAVIAILDAMRPAGHGLIAV